MFHRVVYFYHIIIVYIMAWSLQVSISQVEMEKAIVPKEEFALSLWLISRTGWVYCERAGAYMNATQRKFDEAKCKRCYLELFNIHKMQPRNVTDMEIMRCSRNFGASFAPSFTGSNRQQLGSPFELFRQLNPLETVGVQAFTCNSEVSKNQTLSMDRILMPTVASIFQLFSTREFSSNNDPKRQFPRKAYVDCLFGKLFETEIALCPYTIARRRCAIQSREADEEFIFSSSIPIDYNT